MDDLDGTKETTRNFKNFDPLDNCYADSKPFNPMSKVGKSFKNKQL